MVRFGSIPASSLVNNGFERAGSLAGGEHEAADEMGAQLDLTQRVAGRVRDGLGERDEEHRARGAAQAPAGELGVAHDADNAEGARRFPAGPCRSADRSGLRRS